MTLTPMYSRTGTNPWVQKGLSMEPRTGIFGEMGGVSGSLKRLENKRAARAWVNPLMLLAVSQGLRWFRCSAAWTGWWRFSFFVVGVFARQNNHCLAWSAFVLGVRLKFVQSWGTRNATFEKTWRSSCSSGSSLLTSCTLVFRLGVPVTFVYMLSNGRESSAWRRWQREASLILGSVATLVEWRDYARRIIWNRGEENSRGSGGPVDRHCS